MFGKGENLVATDYQMVRHPDIHQAQCLYQTFGDKPVCLTGCDFTGRVIVCQHHGSGIVVQGAFNHFPGMDFRAVDGTGEEGFTGNQLILVVQIPSLQPDSVAGLSDGGLQPAQRATFPALRCE